MTVKQGYLRIYLIFRNVTQTLDYDNMSSKRVLGNRFNHENCTHLEVFQETVNEYRQNQHHIGSMFADHAKNKFVNWNWT